MEGRGLPGQPLITLMALGPRWLLSSLPPFYLVDGANGSSGGSHLPCCFNDIIWHGVTTSRSRQIPEHHGRKTVMCMLCIFFFCSNRCRKQKQRWCGWSLSYVLFNPLPISCYVYTTSTSLSIPHFPSPWFPLLLSFAERLIFSMWLIMQGRRAHSFSHHCPTELVGRI